MSIKLFKHNETAYRATVSMLAETGKAAVIHPTGTGKSFIAFKLCEENPSKSVLWLSPSEYIFKTQLEALERTAGDVPKNIKFLTYSKLMNLSESEISDLKPDYIILDEFHRAGAEQWGRRVKRLLAAFPKAPVLGLSATNVRYLDNQRDMADELFEGNIASEMTLGEAIVRGILNPPKYVLSIYSYQKDLERYERRVKTAKNKAVRDSAERYLEALRRALDKADGLDVIFKKHMTDPRGKYIVFCANAEHMRAMMAESKAWFKHIDQDFHSYSVYSDDPEASQSFEDFKADDSDHLRLLFCIDALNEGIHVDDVAGVILLRPTVSPIIYKQQIGRALSASSTKNPVIFDIVNNIESLYSIDSIEEEMRVALTYYHANEGCDVVTERFEIFDELQDCKRLFEKLNDALTASWDLMYSHAQDYFAKYGNLDVPRKYKTEDGYSLGQWIFTQRRVYAGEQAGSLSAERIEKLSSIGMIWDSFAEQSWKKNYAAAVAYFNENKDLQVPAGYVTDDGIALGSWISNIRTYRKNGSHCKYLTNEHIDELNAIGMIWDVPDYLWEQNFAAAMRYHQKHGNLDVPATYVGEDGTRLGAWLCGMRRARADKNYRISDEQIAKLDSLGMVWESANSRKWETGYGAARVYHLKYNSLDVPASYVDSNGFRLGGWIADQREKFRAGKLRPERKVRLDELGMVWQKDDPWEVRFGLAERYFNENGDLDVPANYIVDGINISKWLNEQKQAYRGKRKALTEEQISRLESIGMDWRKPPEIAWESNFEKLKVSGIEGKELKKWLAEQRKNLKNGKLTDEQIRKLDSAGMVWETADSWEVGYSHAVEYVNNFGDLDVKKSYRSPDGYALGNWVANQRNNRQKLSNEQVNRLERLGMVWSLGEQKWEQAYEAAKAYFKEFGSLNVPAKFKYHGVDLWEWLRQQRQKRAEGKLSELQIKKLEMIGAFSEPARRKSREEKRISI